MNPEIEETGQIVFWYNMLLMFVTFVALAVYLLYFLIHYASAEDTEFGKSTFARIFIYIGYFLAYSLILTVQFDIYLTQFGIDISYLFYILQWVQLVYVFLAGPSLLVYYESNENLAFVRSCP